MFEQGNLVISPEVAKTALVRRQAQVAEDVARCVGFHHALHVASRNDAAPKCTYALHFIRHHALAASVVRPVEDAFVNLQYKDRC